MLPTKTFGRTGHESTRVIFGAAALGAMSQERADATMQVIDSHGINHIDTARGYGDSELRLAPWLAGNRHKVFLATKTGERSGAAARRELEESLTRIGCRSGRPHPVAQPRRERRVGYGLCSGRGPRGPHQSTRRGPVPVHRCHRTWRAHSRDASPQPARIRLRFGAAAVQLHDARAPGLSRPISKRSSSCASNATSQCRRSKQSHAAGGRVAARASSAGTSR